MRSAARTWGTEMDIFIQQVVSGLATGGIYASLALALVMIYQATDVADFAQGELARCATYICSSLTNAGMAYWYTVRINPAIACVGRGRRLRRRRGNDGRSGPHPGAQSHGRRADLRLRRGDPRGLHEPGRRGARRLHRRRRREPRGDLRELHRHRAQVHGRAGDDHRGAAGQADGTLRQHSGQASVSARHLPRLVGLLALLLAACALPFVLSNFRLFQFSQVYIYAIAILGLNMLTGYNGQVSLGHGAIYAVCAYVSAIMMDRWNIPYGWTIPVAGVLCLIVGFLFGLPALRLEGLYRALATFSLALAVPQILKYFEHWTGGSQGIVLSKPSAPFGLRLNPDQWLYFVTLGVLVLLFWLGANLLRGRVGRAIVAIRDNHIAAEAMGINTALYKSLVFGVSAAYTGVAGALSACVIAYVAPDSFNVFLSVTLLIGSVIGGLASISGAVFGALFIQFVPNWAQDISKAAPWAIFGVFLIGFMYLMPFGIAGGIRLLWIRATRSRVQQEGRSAVPSQAHTTT